MSLHTTTQRYGACIYEIEDLDLSDGGFPGLVFWGTLDIMPDDDGQDWSIREAYALNEKSGIYTIYDIGTNKVVFEAISKAIFANKKLLARIGAHAKEHV